MQVRVLPSASGADVAWRGGDTGRGLGAKPLVGAELAAAARRTLPKERPMPRAPWSATLALASLVAFASCREPGLTGGPSTALFVRVDAAGSSAAMVVVEVSAPDITPPLLFNIPVNNGVAADTISVPAGPSRTFAMRAYAANGVETNAGSVTVDVVPGANPTISIVLTALTGGMPIHATLGNATVSVTPATDTLTTGTSVRLTAAIRDGNGNVVAGRVRWATGDPGVASVDTTGLVTAVGRGTTTIAATFEGVAGVAAVVVR